MSRKYPEKQVTDTFLQYLNNSFNPELFYREKRFFNQRGYSKEGRPYTEIYSELILKNRIIERLNDIKCVYRSNSYNPLTHTATINIKTNQTEKTIAKSLINKQFRGFGRVIGYEIPLQNTSDDVGGDIDLLSYNEATNTAFILELKEPNSIETLLRCSIESYTYYKRVNHTKLLQDFGLPENCTLVPATLIFNGSWAAKEYKDLHNRTFLKELLFKMNSHTFIISIEDIPLTYRELFKIANTDTLQ